MGTRGAAHIPIDRHEPGQAAVHLACRQTVSQAGREVKTKWQGGSKIDGHGGKQTNRWAGRTFTH